VQLYFLVSDILLWILLSLVFLFFIHALREEPLRRPWVRVFKRKRTIIVSVILANFLMVGLLDSIHFQSKKENNYQIYSVLDLLLKPLIHNSERSYSAPFALYLLEHKNNSAADRLLHGGAHLKKESDFSKDLAWHLIKAISYTIIIFLILCTLKKYWGWVFIMTVSTLAFVYSFIAECMPYYHILGTSKIGEDVLYQAIKSIRTGLLIGSLTTLFMLPFAIIMGMMAGYFKGWIDDVIQYIYTLLSSIPSILFIAASVLILEIFMNNHADWFVTLEKRADARLLALCAILGTTTWTNLCRLLRAEVLKLREIEFVQAAKGLGVGHFKIMFVHLLPHLIPIILISVTLDFSALVLAEAVLSYIGIGVDPTSYSWGTMINTARLEIARVPMVWWSLSAAFIFMFSLVLCANIFSDALKDALDPKVQS